MKKDPKIILGYISGDMIDLMYHRRFIDFLSFDSQNRRVTLAEGFQRALYLDDKRNENVREFLKSKADYFMSLDTDIDWQPHQIYELLDEAEKNDRAILAGMYFSFLHPDRAFPYPVWFSDVDEHGSLKLYHDFTITDMIVPIAAAGMGFTLIRRDVFEKMAEVPEWRDDDWTWFGRDKYTYKGLPKHHGEDVCFCVRAGKIGIQSWGHKGVLVRHWKKIPVDFFMFRAMVEAAQREGHEI